MLSILTLNCNGIRDWSKRVGLVQWLQSLPVGAGIVCLQETHCLSSLECSSWFLSSGFSAVTSPGSSHSCGCIVLFCPSLSLVCCVYAPNRNPAWDQFFGDLPSKIDPSIRTVLCGDFKEVFHRSLDHAGSDPPSPLAIPPCLSICLRTVVWWTYGGISTLLLLVLPGPGGMAV